MKRLIERLNDYFQILRLVFYTARSVFVKYSEEGLSGNYEIVLREVRQPIEGQLGSATVIDKDD